jgi:steroid delta-isomerase-like uncharacterized protein
MSIEAHKAVVWRYWEEVRNQRKDGLVEELLAPAYRVNRAGLPTGVAGFRAMDAATREEFPDAHWSIEDMLAEGDQVMTSWTLRGTHLGVWRGVPPTGRPVVLRGSIVHRLVDGRIAGRYGVVETLDVLQQLGATRVPPPGAGQ